MNTILSRLDTAEKQLHALELELAELRVLAGRAPVAEPEPVPDPEPEPVLPPKPVMWPPPTPVRPRAQSTPTLAGFTVPRVEVADLMGARTLAWAGGVVTLLGVVLLFVLAVNRGWIGPVERVAFGAAASAAAIAVGFLVRARYGQYHSALAAVGAGIAGGYATLLAAVVLYDLVPQPVALAIAAGVAAVGVAISLLWDAQLVAGLGLVGAALAPGAVALDSGITPAGTAFAAFMFAATAAVALHRGWRPLLVLGVLASLPQAAALALSESGSTKGALAVTLGVGALYLASGVAAQLRSTRFDRLAAGLILLSATVSFASAAALLEGTAENVVLLAIAGVYSALTAVLFARDRELAAVLAVASLALGAIALANVLDGPALVGVWAAEAAGLAWLAGRVRDLRYGAGALAYLTLAAGHAVFLDGPAEHLYEQRVNPAQGVAALVAVLGSCILVAAATRTWRDVAGSGLVDRALARLAAVRRQLAAGLLWAAGVLAAYAAALGILQLVGDFDWGHVGVAALWAVAGAAVLVLGARLRRFDLFVGGAVWLTIVTLHVVRFDLAELAHPQRAWAALALAVPVLAGAYVVGLVEPRSVTVWLVGILLSGALGAYAAVELAPAGHATGYALLGAAAAYAVLAVPVFPRPALRDMGTLLWGMSLVFALAASAVLLRGTPLVAAWAGAAAALAGLAFLLREGRFQLASAGFLALALVYAVATVAAPSGFFLANGHPASGAPASFLVAAAALAVALLAAPGRLRVLDRLDEELQAAQGPARAGGAWAAGVSALYGVSLAVLGLVAWLGTADVDTEFQRGHTAVSAVWGTIGLVLLYLGLKRGWRALVGAGFALFGVSLAKIFLFDLSQLSSVARAASFLAVGAILLTAGFFYQRFSRA